MTEIPNSVTRVVIVHQGGGYTERWADNWDIYVQDDGRTVKFFPKGEGTTAAATHAQELAADLARDASQSWWDALQ